MVARGLLPLPPPERFHIGDRATSSHDHDRWTAEGVSGSTAASRRKGRSHAPTPRAGAEAILGRGRGWGHGMSVVTDTIPAHPPAGSSGWIGGFGSSWVSDPSKDLTMILLTQREFVSAGGDPIHQAFQGDAYQALA